MRSAACLLALAGFTAFATAAQAGDEKPKHKITQSKSYIMLEPFYATIYDEGRPAGLMMVAIGLDIPDEELRSEADRGMPLLRDDYVRSISSFAAVAGRTWRQPDVVEIAGRLQLVTDRALHRPGARVLLAQVAIRLTR